MVGYPRIFMGEDCNAFTWFSPVGGVAAQRRPPTCSTACSRRSRPPTGFGFANPTGAFIGHAVCDDPEWINGLSNPISDSYHPNQTGPRVRLRAGGGRGARLRVRARPRRSCRRARAQGDELAAQQRQYAALDRTIEPELFQAPDLNSPRVRKAAKAHGINLEHWIAAHT